MPLIAPIYGFQITKPITIGSAIIRPRTADHRTAEKWSRDQSTYHLTGVLVAETATDEFLFNFEAGLAFIERLDVLVGEVVPLDGDDPFLQFDATLNRHRRSDGGGAMIGIDTLFPSSREIFLQKLLQRLEDVSFCETTQFKQLFFKCVEQFRQRRQFVEVSYFFLFSGLETFARAVQNDRDLSAARPISRLLNNYGFDVSIDRPNDLIRAVSTYAHLRNALFHNSEFVAEVNFNGNLVKLKMFDYLFNLTQLANLVVLKAIDFDDQHINWNSWVDRQPFK